MVNIVFSELGSVEDKEYAIVVMATRYKDKWFFCKHEERDTWEFPGGHIEKGEDWLTAAKRELFEETGAVEADIKPICVYKISKSGLLCFAEVKKFDKIPDFEIERIEFFDDVPEKLTYPWINAFFEKGKNFIAKN